MQRETSIDRLADIMNVLHIGHKTGVLTVERGENGTYEEGIIMFVNGQVVEAQVGRRHSVEAMQWLTTWGACRFRFDSSLSVPTQTLPHNIFAPAQSNGQLKNSVQAQGSAPSPSVPRQAEPVDTALALMQSLALSRAHRRLFLLIDGRRNIIDLARLSGTPLDQTYNLLQELQRARLIYY
jgi:Domain of unknown function (DUF4388)